jgi:2-amino-4-hydroxy-6-hydroxymethyldihydropteridine diphosphokinase
MIRETPSVPLIISLGSNLGNRIDNIERATKMLENSFVLTASSHIYQSKAVDYLDQPDFYNQILEFVLPSMGKEAILDIALGVEAEMGRERTIPKGPRNIDIDILFAGEMPFKSVKLILPHPRIFERHFIVIPIRELPAYSTLTAIYDFPQFFPTEMSLQVVR